MGAAVIPSFASLQHVHLDGNPLGENGFIAVTEALPDTLVVIGLDKIETSIIAWRVFSQALTRLAKLERLSISTNTFGPSSKDIIHNLPVTLIELIMSNDL